MNKEKILLSSVAVLFLIIVVFVFANLYQLGLTPFNPALPSPTPTSTPMPTSIPTPTFEPTPVPTPSPTPLPTPTPYNPSDDLLLLVNPWNELPEGYETELVEMPRYTEYTESGKMVYIDKRCHSALMQMLDDCTNSGHSPYICSAYRTQEYQQELFDNKVNAYIYEMGYDRDSAVSVAATVVAFPGTSEHQLGLAADIVDYEYSALTTLQETTQTQKWLMEHCWEYGFILRYPSEKKDVTGIIYEPWHYRYVGRENAQLIKESGLCFEEYLDTLKN